VAHCPFCPPDRPAFHESEHTLALPDAFPVSRGHTLFLPRRHVSSIFDLPAAELAELFTLLTQVRARLRDELHPDAFTIGINDGTAAGQTVEHAHCHLIPRWQGDVADPRGGVRLLLPERARYWDA